MPVNAGSAAEDAALAYLKKQRLKLLARNYKPPGRGTADLDLVMLEKDGTVVFVEVRMRKSCQFGGAGASISTPKQRRLIHAAQHFLLRYQQMPTTRFDVVIFDGENADQPLWLRSAFEVRDN